MCPNRRLLIIREKEKKGKMLLINFITCHIMTTIMLVVSMYSAVLVITSSLRHLAGERLDVHPKFTGTLIFQFSEELKKFEKGEPTPFISKDSSCSEHEFSKKLKPILQHWEALSKQYKVDYTLYASTLLGAFLNHDLIPCVSKLDVLINTDDLSRLKEAQKSRDVSMKTSDDYSLIFQKDWKLPAEKRKRTACSGLEVSEAVDMCSFKAPIARLVRNGHFMNIYGYTTSDSKSENNSLKIAFDGTLNNLPKPVFFPTTQCRLMNININCPKDSRYVLGMLYSKTEGMKKLLDSLKN